MRLTKHQRSALEYFGLDYAKSDEPGAGWFAYTHEPGGQNDYPGSSCECLDDVDMWYAERVAARARGGRGRTIRCLTM